jgi:holliday junction DNA helicase RuvA
MIAYIQWHIFEKNTASVTILTSGWVWYELWVHETTLFQLPDAGEVEMHVYDHITENARTLFGFLNKQEKGLFTELLKISWVGWKVALQILSLWVSQLIQAVALEDKKTIEGVKWIGKKMAEKIILELKDKDLWIIPWNSMVSSASHIDVNLHQSIKSTLVGMGYQPLNVDDALGQLPEDMKDASDILPYIIQQLS